MKRTFLLWVITLASLAMSQAVHSPASAEDVMRGFTLAARVMGGTCSGPASVGNAYVATCAPSVRKLGSRVAAGVTCNSNQFCCRVDAKTGECKECCNK